MFRNAHSKLRQRGSILMFLTFAIPFVLIPLVGLAIDATMLRITQARLSAAVDGAVLGAGRLLGTSADPAAVATEFVKANFQAGVIGTSTAATGFWGANNLVVTPTYTPGITQTISINATADIPLLFSRILGQASAPVAAAGTATRTQTRIMLVIDRSGSMDRFVQSDGNFAITDAINDATQFVESWNPGTDEVGLVIFDGSAVIAYPDYTAAGVPTTWSSDVTSAGGPDTAFNTVVKPATVGPVISKLQMTVANANGGSTNTAEALWLAYIELQKAHLRDIKGGVTDTRLNAIVLMTDGIPQSVTIYPNFATPSSTANYFMVSAGSSCPALSLYSAVNKSPKPIIGFMQESLGGGVFGTPAAVTPNLYQPASTDTSYTTNTWLSAQGDSTHPGAGGTIKLESKNDSSCTGLFGGSGNDLKQIPNIDAYGNVMNSSAYLNSIYVDGTGKAVAASSNEILDKGHTLNVNSINSGIDWAQAEWNAAFSAGQRIRQDINLANRAGDSKLPIYIYTIGFLGDGGADQGLLASIANDKVQSPTYDSSTLSGVYIPATDPDALHNAFQTIAATILRLAK
ncbi:conserved exported hypothetical protein [Candidatus Sulfopaludibacter sp. SbA3]|nr:conserved exported hypothetical protein [Candidatus Sulfopaludibacter sp. SbA3]